MYKKKKMYKKLDVDWWPSDHDIVKQISLENRPLDIASYQGLSETFLTTVTTNLYF